MNRRTLLQSMALAPMVAPANLGIRLRSLEESFTISHQVPVQMLLQAYSSSAAAEAWRQDWAGRAFLGQGEWYLDSTEEIGLSPQLAGMPGSLHLHHYTAGVAAVRSSMLVGAFRRDHVACVFRIKGMDESTMSLLAEFFSSVPIPEPWELAWNDAQLQAFVPTADTLGVPVGWDDQFWP